MTVEAEKINDCVQAGSVQGAVVVLICLKFEIMATGYILSLWPSSWKEMPWALGRSKVTIEDPRVAVREGSCRKCRCCEVLLDHLVVKSLLLINNFSYHFMTILLLSKQRVFTSNQEFAPFHQHNILLAQKVEEREQSVTLLVLFLFFSWL